jgi:hypothetical protein
VERLLGANESRQALGAPGDRDNAKLNLRQAVFGGRDGDGAFSMVSSATGRWGGAGGLPNSEMSAPAMKVRPSQMMTIALTAPFASCASTPRFRPSRTGCERAFTGGEFIVTTATSPSIERSATELMTAMGCFLWNGRDKRR